MRAATLLGSRRVATACLGAARGAATPAPLAARPAAAAPFAVAPAGGAAPLSALAGAARRASGGAASTSAPAPAPRSLRAVAAAAAPGAVAARPAPPKADVLTGDPANNVTDYIYSKMGANLHLQADHPIGVIKQARVLACRRRRPSPLRVLRRPALSRSRRRRCRLQHWKGRHVLIVIADQPTFHIHISPPQAIYDYFNANYPGVFTTFDDLHPIVSARANFDEVRRAAGGRAGVRVGRGAGSRARRRCCRRRRLADDVWRLAPHPQTPRCSCPPTTCRAAPTTPTT
jgi:hypothetical protein